MIRPSRKAAALLAVTLLIISCDYSTFAAPPQIIPTAPPEAIGTIVAQTAAAASTQTAALLPPTLTPSITPLPSHTPSITPSPTATFVFRLPTTTKVKTATPASGSGGSSSSGGGGGGGGGSGSGFSCSLISRTPANGAHFSPSQSFTENWKVKNTGSEKWASTSVDFIYAGDENMASISGMDLPSTVNVGGTITLSVNMTAPSGAGTHKTTWALREGKNQFCTVSLSIVVP